MNEPAPVADIAEGFSPGAWKFTPDVADVFDEHVRASVPFYDAIQNLVAEATDWLVPTQGLIADLGAATGATISVILNRHPGRDIRAVLYDEQPAMLAKATTRLSAPTAAGQITYHAQRIEAGLEHEDADLTLALFTLQFMPQQARVDALAAARKAASSTGALIIAEKIRCRDPRWAEIGHDVSHDWKAEHGISSDAIRAKARALRGVLIPNRIQTLTAMINETGWSGTETLFRWHQWVVVGAFAD